MQKHVEALKEKAFAQEGHDRVTEAAQTHSKERLKITKEFTEMQADTRPIHQEAEPHPEPPSAAQLPFFLWMPMHSNVTMILMAMMPS